MAIFAVLLITSGSDPTILTAAGTGTLATAAMAVRRR